ncbi:MAG: hypothetical protein QNK37_35240 [Acidobacteriota bacterium]|nr:hypothetical protein [Acidobacteriota bacterium]
MQTRDTLHLLQKMRANTEHALCTYIELYGHIAEHFMLTYHGSIVAIFRVAGVDYEGLDLREQRHLSERFAKQLQAVDKDALLYWWLERREVAVHEAPSKHPVYELFRGQREQRLRDKVFYENRIYVALEWPFAQPEDHRPLKERVPAFIHDLMEAGKRRALIGFLRDWWVAKKKTAQLTIRTDALHAFIETVVKPAVTAFQANFHFLSPELLGHQAAYEALLPLFNPSPEKQAVPQVAAAPLNTMLELSNYALEDGMVRVDGRYLDVLSLRNFDQRSLPNMLGRLQNLDFPLIISTQWRRMDDGRAEGIINRQRRGFKHTLKLGNPNRDTGADIQRGFEDQIVDHLDHALTDLKNGRWFGAFSLFVRISGASRDELILRKTQVRSILFDMNCLPHDEDMGLIFAWASLAPGSFWKYNYRKLILTNANYSDWVPIWALEQGALRSKHYDGPALSQLETRNGNLYHFNLSSSDNLNFMVLGKIGSGKSFFLKYHIIQYHKYGRCFFWLHTLGSDYNDLAAMFDGAIIQLDLNGSFPINLYCLEDTLTAGYLDVLLHIWTNLFLAVGHAVTEDELDELTQKLKVLFLQPKAQRHQRALHTLVSDQLKPLIQEFIDDEISQGRFGLFDGRFGKANCLTRLASFTVIDYKKLGDNLPVSQAAMIFVTFMQDQVIYDPEATGVNKFCWFDEGHKILGSRETYMWRYLNKAGDTWRKEGCSLGFITQKLSDLKQLSLHHLFRECCSQFLFFPNPGIDEAEMLGTFDFLSEKDVDHIRTMTEKSEVLFVTTTGVKKVLRLHVDRFTQLVLESNPKLVARKNALLAEHGFPGNIHQLMTEMEDAAGQEAPSAFGIL